MPTTRVTQGVEEKYKRDRQSGLCGGASPPHPGPGAVPDPLPQRGRGRLRQQFDLRAVPMRPAQSGIAGEKGCGEGFGKYDISRIIRGNG